MTEPLDLDAIETEARAYVDTHSGEHLLPCGIYLQATLKIIDELRAPPGADVMEPLGKEFEKVLHDNLPNLYVRSDQGGAPPCADVDALASAIFQGEITDWPARAARALQQYGDERAATRDAEIARLREVFDRTCKQHAEAMRGTCNTYQAIVAQRDAEIARLREVERRHLGWCDACQVYHRTGNCPVTGEPPSKEAREGWSLPTPQAAPPGADAMELFDRVFSPGNIIGMPAGDFRDMAVRALQQYGDERAREATEAERRRCATIDHTETMGRLAKGWVDIDLIRREARDAAIEEVAAAIKNLPSCPFDKPTRLKPEEPCPVCGDTGEFNDKPSNCSSPMIAIHALAAKPGRQPAETGQ